MRWTSFFSRRSGQATRRPNSRHKRRPLLEALEDRLALSTILWTNRGNAQNDSDGFAGVFCVGATMSGATCASAETARNVVATALSDWQNVIASFNYSDPNQGDTYRMTVNMAASGTSLGANAGPSAQIGGKPISGSATIGRGNDTDGDQRGPRDGNGNPTNLGDGAGWFLDATPRDHSEFLDTLVNAFTGTAPATRPDGTPNPIAGQADLYTLMVHEFGHALGFTGDANYLLRRSGLMTNTGVTDTASLIGPAPSFNPCTTDPAKVDANTPICVGTYWDFNGPSIRHLMTSFDSGGQSGVPVDSGFGSHSATVGSSYLRVTPLSVRQYVGADDLMNPYYQFGKRELIPNTMALILQDAYGYRINLPQKFATFYTVLNESTGELRVRGIDASNDVITVTAAENFTLRVSVDIGSDVPATGSLPGAGNLPPFVTDFFSTQVRSMVVESNSGDDIINIHTTPRRLAIRAGAGQDTINIKSLPQQMVSANVDGGSEFDRFVFGDNLDFIASSVKVHGGSLLGDDMLEISDQGNSNKKRSYIVRDSHVELPNGKTITYESVGSVNLEAGTAADATVNVYSTSSAVDTFIEKAANVHVGAPPVFCSNCGSVTKDIRGFLTISSDLFSGNPTALTIDDSGGGTPRNIAITPNAVQGLTENEIDIRFARLSSLTINGSTGGNVFELQDTGPREIAFGSLLITPYRGAVILNTGTGVDTVHVQRTQTGVTVNGENSVDPTGQNRKDTVNIGLNQSLQAIQAPVTVTNVRNWSAVNLDNSADTIGRNVEMSSVGGYSQITGLAPAAIRLRQRDLSALNILGGPGNNNFFIRDTPRSTIPGGMETNLRAGTGNDSVRVVGTTGDIVVDVQRGENTVTIGLNPSGLNRLNGAVTVRGAGGTNYLTVNDAPATTGHAYILDRNVVQRTDKAAIFYEDLFHLDVTAGAAADQITIRDTSPSNFTSVRSGGGSDAIAVVRTTGELGISAGEQTYIEIGNSTNSLDNIQGPIVVVPAPNNSMTLRLNDTAATAFNIFHVSGNNFLQLYKRTGAADIASVFGSVSHVEYAGGSGGTTAFVDSTPSSASLSLFGHAGALDTFAIGFGADMNKILGGVNCFGQAADNDFAYYYEYLNPHPQSYVVQTSPFFPNALLFWREGIAPVGFHGLGQVIFYTPLVGGNTVNVRGVPTPTLLNMAAGDHDVVTLGSNAPNLGGDLSGILGHIQIGAYQYYPQPGDGEDLPLPYRGAVSLIVDDTGNATTARTVDITSYDFLGTRYGRIDGLTPGGITFQDLASLDVDLRGGDLDDRFLMSGDPLATRMVIDGGMGNDVLVGTGGNILLGGAGRDLLIAGAQASYLYGDDDEDILIGGTLNDSSQENLDAIMAEWAQTGEGNDYNSRVARLRAGLLADANLTGNGGSNTLTGGAGLDLFFGSLATELDDGEQAFPL